MLPQLFEVFAGLALLSVPAAAKTAVSQDVFDNLIRYTAFAGASYSNDCATPPSNSTVLQTFDNTATDTHATLLKDDATKELIISFRGTSTPANLDTDLELNLTPLSIPGVSCSSCNVHSGFQTAYVSIAEDVIAAIKSAQSSTGYKKLTVTGHSLGGAIAALATPSLIGSGVPVTNTYTYGEPRNGDPAWAAYVESKVSNKNYFRTTHYNDGVPQIPPAVLGFQHHGPEYWESVKLGNNVSTTFSCGTNSTACNSGQDFGSDPINGAHLTYSNTVIGTSLHNPACGASLLSL